MTREDPPSTCRDEESLYAQGNRICHHSWDAPMLIGIPIVGVVVILIVISSLCGWLP